MLDLVLKLRKIQAPKNVCLSGFVCWMCADTQSRQPSRLKIPFCSGTCFSACCSVHLKRNDRLKHKAKARCVSRGKQAAAAQQGRQSRRKHI
mgnify:CR=1 FL=1